MTEKKREIVQSIVDVLYRLGYNWTRPAEIDGVVIRGDQNVIEIETDEWFSEKESPDYAEFFKIPEPEIYGDGATVCVLFASVEKGGHYFLERIENFDEEDLEKILESLKRK